MPLHAFALKQYLCGSVPVSSTSLNEATNNKDSASALRDGTGMPLCSHPLSVENPVTDPVPQLHQPPEEENKIPSSV
jgi:hypothetical protein